MNALRQTFALTAFCTFLLSLAPPLHSATSRYVNTSNPTPASPFTSWATAATNIQDAVDAAAAGDEIIVTNGVYQTVARAVYGASNRVAVTRPVVLRSVNGPETTRIVGYPKPGVTNGPEAIRCVYLTNGAVLAGFTLAQGATLAAGDSAKYMSGGGVFCDGREAMVNNCVIVGNAARDRGGGAYGGTVENCVLEDNSADNTGGGAAWSTLRRCTIRNNTAIGGAGASQGRLQQCAVVDNVAATLGGGTHGSTLEGCVVRGNSAINGGGAANSTMRDGLLELNRAAYGGGANLSDLASCTIHSNAASNQGAASTVARQPDAASRAIPRVPAAVRLHTASDAR